MPPAAAIGANPVAAPIGNPVGAPAAGPGETELDKVSARLDEISIIETEEQKKRLEEFLGVKGRIGELAGDEEDFEKVVYRHIRFFHGLSESYKTNFRFVNSARATGAWSTVCVTAPRAP